MKILVGQPKQEAGIQQLKDDIEKQEDVEIVLYPEGYLSDEKQLRQACLLAKEKSIILITSYRKEQKDRAVVIDDKGTIILERPKTPAEDCECLYSPMSAKCKRITIGYLLCMEVLKGMRDFKTDTLVDFIAHPIGVGMFSDLQFSQWVGEAQKIAKANHTMMIGTSHADGSYRNCGISLPISYCVDETGKIIYISKSDTRTRIIDLKTKKVNII